MKWGERFSIVLGQIVGLVLITCFSVIVVSGVIAATVEILRALGVLA